MKTLKTIAAGILLAGGLMYGVTPKDDTLHVYFGLLHSHTLTSDGSGTPEEAYKMAKQNGLDFFAETPHNHREAEDGAKERRDGVLIATNPALYNNEDPVTVTRRWKDKAGDIKTETVTLKSHLRAAKEATSEKFCALYGQEFSTISSGNHVNVLGIDEVITVANGDYKELLTLLKRVTAEGKLSPILQMNHPNVTKDLFYKGTKANEIKKMYNDYGADDLGTHFSEMIREMSPYMHLIELLSGPAMAESRKENHRYRSHENDYYFYLRQGFKISPSAGQDNHYKTWGSVTDARMGVLADELTQEALFNAMRKHRTFVTEDKNLKVVLYINNAVMGSSIKAEEESQLQIKVKIEDSDEPETTYRVEVYGGEINAEPVKKATNWHASDGLLSEYSFDNNGTFSAGDMFTQSGPYFFYVKIIQDDGDEAWSAPVWINYDTPFIQEEAAVTSAGSQMYYWSKAKSSPVYHKEGCVSIDRISEQNLQFGTTPPNGRELHQCRMQAEGDI